MVELHNTPHNSEITSNVLFGKCGYQDITIFSPTTRKLSLQASLYSLSAAIVGAHVSSIDEDCFTKIYFDFDVLHEWLCRKGIFYEEIIIPETKEVVRHILTWCKSPDISIIMSDMNLIFQSHLSRSKLRKGHAFNEVSNLTTIHQKPVSLDYGLNHILKHLRSILTIFTNHPVRVDGLSGEVNSKSKPLHVDIYIPGLINPPRKEIPFEFEMLLSFQKIEDMASQIFQKWFENIKVFDPAYDLYNVVQYTPELTLESKFLFMAQALEFLATHHLFKEAERMENKLSLKMKIENLVLDLQELTCKVFNPDEEFIKAFVTTRNYLTHWNPHKKDKSWKGNDLHFAILKLDVLFKLTILKQLGLSQEKLLEVANGNVLQNIHRRLILNDQA